MAYSSVFNTEDGGVYMAGSTHNNITIDSCCFYNLNSVAASAAPGAGIMNVITTGTSINITNNIFIRLATSGTGSALNVGIYLADVGITFNNNTIVGVNGGGGTSPAILFDQSAPLGSFSGNTIHSCGVMGLGIRSVDLSHSTISNTTSWRCGGGGLALWSFTSASLSRNINFDTFTLFGNTGSNIEIGDTTTGGSAINIVFSNGVIDSEDVTYTTAYGVRVDAWYAPVLLKFNSCKFGEGLGIKGAHTTADILPSPAGIAGLSIIYLNNCLLASSTEVGALSEVGSFVKSTKHDQTAGTHKSWFAYGIIETDTTAGLFRTASPSERLTPNTASFKLESGSKLVAVNNGATATSSVYVRESVAGDGTDYNGNRPRLILKRNDAIGITADTVIDTATVSSEGAFEQLTGTTAAATDNGVMEFVVDCDGTTGWVNTDDWTV